MALAENNPRTEKTNSLLTRLAKDPSLMAVLSLFVFQLLLVYFEFIPNLGDLYFFDEALYVNWGRLLVEGQLPPLADNPLMAAFYALTYLPFVDSPHWLVQSTSLGRFLMFVLMWWGAYLVARQLHDEFQPIVLMGFVFVSPAITEIVKAHQSDALFAAMSAFTLWQLLKYWHTKNDRHVWLASLFLGLAELTRNDGLVLFVIFLILVALIRSPLKEKGKNLLLAALPFAVLVGGYVLLHGAVTGDYATGVSQRSYIAFRQGHDFPRYDATGLRVEGANSNDFEKLFGTQEENNNSFLQAILNHPAAYFERLVQIVKYLPIQYLTAYNKKMAIPILLLALRGIWALLRRRKYLLLAILVSWAAYLGTYFLTFFREGYLWMPFPILFALAAAGLTALLDNLTDIRERSIWSLALLLFAVYGLWDGKLAFFYGAGVFLAGIWLVYVLRDRRHILPQPQHSGLRLLLCIGLILRGSFPTPRIQTLGANADEQGVQYMIENFEPGSIVAAGAPGPVWAARMEFQKLGLSDAPRVSTAPELHTWLVDHQVDAIYLDYHLARNTAVFYGYIQEETGKGLERVFMGAEGDVQIFRVLPTEGQ